MPANLTKPVRTPRLQQQDIDNAVDTLIIYAYREGEGIGQHPNGNRGAATVNFATGNVEAECDDNDFVLLHGALMLVAWMVLAPMGIYYVRYFFFYLMVFFSREDAACVVKKSGAGDVVCVFV